MSAYFARTILVCDVRTLPMQVLLIVEHDKSVPIRWASNESVLMLFFIVYEAVTCEDIFGSIMIYFWEEAVIFEKFVLLKKHKL